MAAVIVALEGLVALGLGVYAAVGTLTGQATETLAGVAEAAFGLLIGAGLIWVAWGGLLRAERWGRAPGVLTQIFMIPVSVTVIQSGQPAIGVPLLVVAIAGLATLLAPPTTKALYGD
ncbi:MULTISPECIES: hypothetical protein [unclassified Nonomuraea]|uniref:hypothetical protein n=1 Tax=Nonomuraea sp. NPDC003804 TaxID=3154547 RepID=UPI0033A2890E